LTSSSIEAVGVRPYARLLTMLGEQLIKNDRIALVELLKNSYDADASRVTVDFRDFDSRGEQLPRSRIVILDDGDGMDYQTIKQHWLNPATPTKLQRKRERSRTEAGRVMQGEKGIGRFAIFKLGSFATITTRARESNEEIVLTYDLSFLDGAAAEREPTAPLFLDEIKVQLERRSPVTFDSRKRTGSHGVQIEIEMLRSSWGQAAIEAAYREAARLRPLVKKTQVSQSYVADTVTGFDVSFAIDGLELPYAQEIDDALERLFEDNAVLKVDGLYSHQDQEFLLSVNGEETILPLTHPEVLALKVYRDLISRGNLSDIGASPGPFEFSFFVFDLTASAPPRHKLSNEDKRIVKDHRIYLYRDGVRVLPYGDPDDDWLRLDVIRGTQGADLEISNDQTVGFVYITQSRNPKLQDKTNREGLLEDGRAARDLIGLLQIVTSWLRAHPFARYKARTRDATVATAFQTARVPKLFAEVLDMPGLTSQARSVVSDLERAYTKEREYLTRLTTTTEDLAGVGLSVEAASHDLLATLQHAVQYARQLDKYVEKASCLDDKASQVSTSLLESLSFVQARMQDVQGLFVSSRQRRREINVRDMVDRVALIYRSILERESIRVEIIENSPITAFATDAALLQLLVNLFDNSTYWLRTRSQGSKQIRIILDGDLNELIYSDSGPGISIDDAPFIFEPFYSGKGDNGKGLGLYIARQIGLRAGFEIQLLPRGNANSLSGAVFNIKFDSRENRGK
jgi:signal transduction histidine kinase